MDPAPGFLTSLNYFMSHELCWRIQENMSAKLAGTNWICHNIMQHWLTWLNCHSLSYMYIKSYHVCCVCIIKAMCSLICITLPHDHLILFIHFKKVKYINSAHLIYFWHLKSMCMHKPNSNDNKPQHYRPTPTACLWETNHCIFNLKPKNNIYEQQEATSRNFKPSHRPNLRSAP